MCVSFKTSTVRWNVIKELREGGNLPRNGKQNLVIQRDKEELRSLVKVGGGRRAG